MQPYHITVAVAVDQKRPKIPPLGPRAFPREARKLVTDCWRQDPEGRPAAMEIEQRMQAILRRLPVKEDDEKTTTGAQTLQ